MTKKASKASDLNSFIVKDEVQPTKSPYLVCAPRGFHIRNVKCSRHDRGAKAKL